MNAWRNQWRDGGGDGLASSKTYLDVAVPAILQIAVF
jgi:hypothetical protein